jgi:hypothetical protein
MTWAVKFTTRESPTKLNKTNNFAAAIILALLDSPYIVG